MSLKNWRQVTNSDHPCAGVYEEDGGRADCERPAILAATYVTGLGIIPMHFCGTCAKHEKDVGSRDRAEEFISGEYPMCEEDDDGELESGVA